MLDMGFRNKQSIRRKKDDEKTIRAIARAERRADENYVPEMEELAEIYPSADYPSIESDVREFVYRYLKGIGELIH